VGFWHRIAVGFFVFYLFIYFFFGNSARIGRLRPTLGVARLLGCCLKNRRRQSRSINSTTRPNVDGHGFLYRQCCLPTPLPTILSIIINDVNMKHYSGLCICLLNYRKIRTANFFIIKRNRKNHVFVASYCFTPKRWEEKKILAFSYVIVKSDFRNFNENCVILNKRSETVDKKFTPRKNVDDSNILSKLNFMRPKWFNFRPYF